MSAAPDCLRKSLLGLVLLSLTSACGTTTGGGGSLPDIEASKDVLLPSFGKDVPAAPKDVKADVAPKPDVPKAEDLVALEDLAEPEDTALPPEDVPALPDVQEPPDVPPDVAPPPDVPVAKDTVAKDIGSVCDPITSANCKSTEQCYVSSKGAPTCALPGKLTKGSACKFLADCAKGLLCVDSACRPVCDAVADPPTLACSGAALCVELEGSSGPLGYNLGACIGGDACNLLTNGCPVGLMCMPFATDKACLTEGTLAVGGDCTASAGLCKADGVCIPDETGGKKHCLQKCGADGSAPKCTTKTCGTLSIGDPPKSAPDNLGACL